MPSTALPDPGDEMDAEQVRDWVNNIISFLEGTNIDEANIDLSGTDGVVGKSTAQSITGLKSFESTSVAAGGVREVVQLGLDPASGTPAANDGGRLVMYADDAGGAESDIAYIDWVMTTATAGAEVGRLDFYVAAGAGSAVSQVQIRDGSVVPTTTDDISLGTTALNFSDLFLDSGAVINFDSGDVTETHAANTLTWAGATSGYIFNDGPVGIGGTPNDQLHVYGADGAVTGETWNGATQVAIENNGNLWVELMTANTSYAVLAFSDPDASTRGAVIYDHGTALGWGADAIVFQTAGSQRVAIDAVGNLGFTITPGSWLSTLDAIRLGGNATLHALGATGASNYFVISQNAILATDGTYDYISTDEASRYYQQDGAHTFSVVASGTAGNDITWVNGLQITTAANVVVNQAAIATTATDGFIYIPSCAGTPAGAPTAYTGRVAMVYDSTNNLLYCNDGGGWVAANNP